MLVFVEKEIFETEITGNELAIMGTNQLALKTNYANAIEQLEKQQTLKMQPLKLNWLKLKI